MKENLLTQAVNFEEIIHYAFPKVGKTSSGIDILDPNLTIGTIISRLIPYVFAAAGLVLLVILILGGFELLTSAGDPEKIKSGQGKILSGFIGFIIIFVAWWLVRILETILGIGILGYQL